MTTDNDPKLWAADHLEQLLMVGKEYVKVLRDPTTTDQRAYALLYYLRAELGKVTRVLGADLPTKREWNIAKSIAEQHLGEDS